MHWLLEEYDRAEKAVAKMPSESRRRAVQIVGCHEIDAPEDDMFTIVLRHAFQSGKVELVKRLGDLTTLDSRKEDVFLALFQYAETRRKTILSISQNMHRVIVLSTRYHAPREWNDMQPRLTPLAVSDVVTAYTEAFADVDSSNFMVYNPNRDNVAMRQGDVRAASGTWLLMWRQMLDAARDTRGFVLRLEAEGTPLTDMQVAETDMAADKGVMVRSLGFDCDTTEDSVKASLNELLMQYTTLSSV